MSKQPADTNRDAAMRMEATIAAILTLAVVPQSAAGHSPENRHSPLNDGPVQ